MSKMQAFPVMNSKPGQTLLGLSFQELSQLVAESGEPAYRARQLFQAVYADRAENVDSVTTLPVNFREALKNRGLDVGLPKIEKKFVSSDGTVRYLLSFGDGQSVETVWMPEGDGGETGDGSEAGEEEEEEVESPGGRNW